MPYARKLVLHTPNGVPTNIEALARQFVDDGVAFVAAVGPDCEKVEEWIDEIAVANGSPATSFILTSSHPDESLEEAIELAKSLSGDYAGDVEVVEAR
jgi:hypothetical protein